MAKIICSRCGKQLQGDYPICPYCKTPRAANLQAPSQKKASRKEKKKHPILKAIGVSIFLVVALSALFGGSKEEESKKSAQNAPSGNKEIEQSNAEPKINPEVDLNGYMKIDADVLFEYGGYLGGENVVTVIVAENVENSSKMIKARTSNNDGYFFSVVCNFEEKTSVEKGETVTVAGTVKEDKMSGTFLDAPTATLENCKLVGFGEIAEELKAGGDGQRQVCEAIKQEKEKEIAARKKQERDEYISQCTTVNYTDVERNPDNYMGAKVKFSGEVIQVSEGFLDSVTLRVSCSGDVWYVTYSREDGESRILEGDTIACYGECSGVQSYVTVLGSQVTIPSLKMKYYN